jgi:hypothetical protein
MYGCLEFPDRSVIRFINDHTSDRIDPELFDPTSSTYWTAAFAEAIDRDTDFLRPLDLSSASTIKHTVSFASPPDSVDTTLLRLQVRDAVASGPGSEVVDEESVQH